MVSYDVYYILQHDGLLFFVFDCIYTYIYIYIYGVTKNYTNI